VDQRVAELTASLIDSGTAATVLADWVAVLKSQAADLVDEATVDSEAQSIRSIIANR
jgi:hypothetical protein